MTAKLTREEVEERRYQFDFEKLLDPYREGGTEKEPVRRTMGTIIDYLLNKKKYPQEVVGAGILAVFMQLKNGKVFPGDGTYGSRGRELVTAIRIACDRLARKKLQADLYGQIAQGRMEEMKTFISNQMLVTISPLFLTPWYKKLPFSKYKKWRKALKKHLKTVTEPSVENVPS